MPTNSRFARSLALAGLLIAATLSSGCGFLCLAEWQCPIGCCVSYRCTSPCLAVPIKAKIDDAPRVPDFTDLLITLFPPTELEY